MRGTEEERRKGGGGMGGVGRGLVKLDFTRLLLGTGFVNGTPSDLKEMDWKYFIYELL